MTASAPRRSHRRFRAVGAAALAIGIALAAPLSATAAGDGPDDIIVTVPGGGATEPPIADTVIRNAQLRWALNAESGGGGFAPGTCNFLSAGVAGDSGGPAVWADGGNDTTGIPLYRTQDGSARIEKPLADGGWTVASASSRCLDPQGNRVSTSAGSTSGNQVVLDGGAGSVRNGVVEIRWSGSFTVVYYSGMTYWSLSDPVLTLDAGGNGRLTGTASGFGADMDDTTKWERLEPREIVVAEIRAADVGGADGFVVTPQYLGVTVDTRGGAAQTRSGSSWGAFPQSFVDFQQLTGQHSYWYSSGGAADAKKPAAPVYVSYDAAAPVAVPVPPAGEGPAAAAPSNPLRAAPPVAPAAAVAALPGLPATTALITQPQRDGLIPGGTGRVPPVVAPLLGSAAALSAAILSVLSMMRLLPWQRRLL